MKLSVEMDDVLQQLQDFLDQTNCGDAQGDKRDIKAAIKSAEDVREAMREIERASSVLSELSYYGDRK